MFVANMFASRKFDESLVHKSCQLQGELDAVGEKFAKSRKAELVSATSRTAGDSLVYTLELKGEKFHDDAYDQNNKFSVHLQVEEDKYLQKLQAMARQSKVDTSKKDCGNQIDQFELANQEYEA